MNLNSDFGARAAIHAARLDWTPSPIPGVDRRMLPGLKWSSQHFEGGAQAAFGSVWTRPSTALYLSRLGHQHRRKQRRQISGDTRRSK